MVTLSRLDPRLHLLIRLLRLLGHAIIFPLDNLATSSASDIVEQEALVVNGIIRLGCSSKWRLGVFSQLP
jgi:hypothetical protein